MAFDMKSRAAQSRDSVQFNIDKQSTVAPAESDAVLMLCPETHRAIGNIVEAIKSGGYRSYKIIRANGDLQVSQILAKNPTVSREEAEAIAYSPDWDEHHKSLIVNVLGISEEELPSIFYSWDDFIVKHPLYSEFLTVATQWFFEDPFLQSEILRSVKEYLDAYFPEELFPTFDDIDFSALLSADINTLDNPKKSLRHSIDHKLKEIAGLFVKAERGAQIFNYVGKLDPGLAAALDKIHQIPKYQNRIVFQEIVRQKRKQVLTLELPETIGRISYERSRAPTIAGAARYTIFDMPLDPSYQSVELVLRSAVAHAKDPGTALTLLNAIAQLVVDYQRDIIFTAPQISHKPTDRSLENDRVIYYEPISKK